MPGGVVGHGFKNAANRFLVVLWNASVLLYKAVFDGAQRILNQCHTDTSDDVGNVETEVNTKVAQIRSRRIAGPRLVISLGSLRNTESISDFCLSHTASLPFFLQPGTNLFGKMQNYSSHIFTNAQKCIILHFTPHEIAWICTMPKTSISEQARQQAREALEKRGQSAKDFADLHNLSPSTVYAVLSGQSQCRRGEAHRAAVLLGIKDGVIEQ